MAGRNTLNLVFWPPPRLGTGWSEALHWSRSEEGNMILLCNPRVRIAPALVLLLGSAMILWGQSNGYLKASVNPGRAGVFVDGKYVGPAANFRVTRKYTVPAGEHEVKLVDPRFEEYTTKVHIEAGKTTKIRETLKPLPLEKPP